MPTLTPEQESLAARADMPRDTAAHLSRSVFLRLLSNGLEGLPEDVLPHLIECSACRASLHQSLTLAGTPTDHPARIVLEDAEIGARWASAGQTAAAAACRELAEQGIGYVYGRGGEIYRRLPDGKEERVAGPRPSSA